jgi:holo-[acyl-carrier protein] synthase
MIKGVGNDIIEIKRIEGSIHRHGQRFLDKVFTPAEQDYCLRHNDSERHFAGRFAAKEAVLKALGTGLRDGISWLDIDIHNDEYGKPFATFSHHIDEQFGTPQIQLSISHCKEFATAIAIRI